MSDFLHNLRTGNIKRYDRPRKNYDNPQYRNQHDRQYSKDRRGNYHKKMHTGDQLLEIKKQLDSIGQAAERSLKIQEKAASALDRIAIALEAAAGIEPRLQAAPDTHREQQASPPVKEISKPVQAVPAPREPSEKSLLATITNMRNDGFSFEKIAAELESRKIQTVSGRGKWRGQAVSKLLKDGA